MICSNRLAAHRMMLLLSLLTLSGLAGFEPGTNAQTKVTPIRGHIPNLVQRSQMLGRVDAQEQVHLAISLPLRNQPQLDTLLQSLYTPGDPQYQHYLTPEQFTATFGPTEADYAAVTNYAKQQGLTVAGVHSNRTLLDVVGTAQQMETAFQVHLMNYQAPDNRVFRAPDAEPAVPAAIAQRISGLIGLDTAVVRHPHSVPRNENGPGARQPHDGSGPGGGYSPADIKKAYNLSSTGLNGSGQTLALFELDGYRASDITAYENYFGLTAVPLQNVLIDGATGKAGSSADEVTLDLELMVALASGATKIIVYESVNTDAGSVDCFNRIATDNLAKEISVSWGGSEDSTSLTILNSESNALKQMAAQGQSIFAAAGDSGAYDNESTLSVDDPGSQPYMVSVGGTTMTMTGTGLAYQSETTWNAGSITDGAGGGGISTIWPIPSWQAGVISSQSKASKTMRNVPDVALNADPNTGYAIYYRGWSVYGGTSSATPLWAAFTALVNQQRTAHGLALLGFANPTLYAIGSGARYASDFHDIADGSDNLYFTAVTGYDDATGWGSFNGANLLADLTGGTTIFDLNGDGKPDILWQDSLTGTVAYWLMNGTTQTSSGIITASVLPEWHIVGTADLNGDGKPDILWQDSLTGAVTYWLMNGTTQTSTGFITTSILPEWHIVGVADLNGDGKPDILWQDTITGAVAYWLMNGTTQTSSGFITASVLSEWHVVGIVDLNGDGKPDLLWQDTITGAVAYWLMNGTTQTSTGIITTSVLPEWRIVAPH